MRRKNSLIIPAVLAFSLCTVTAVPVLAEDAAQTEAEKGTITETDYQSEWLNLKFTPPETVVMNTEEELESVMRQGQSTLEKSSGMELGEDALSGTVYEMMASSVSGFPNVSLVVEDASLENMTVDQYFLLLSKCWTLHRWDILIQKLQTHRLADRISALWKPASPSMITKFFRNTAHVNREESLSPSSYPTPQILRQKQMKSWQLLLH